jgi:putative ABC transport system permease protein
MDWTRCVRNEFRRLRKPVAPIVIEELVQHAADAYRDARAEGASQADAESKVFDLVMSWCAATSGPRRTQQHELPDVPPVPRSLRAQFIGLPLDVRQALRLLWREPGFAIVSMVLIGLAIAGTTTILTVINGVVFRPLPWVGAEGVVRVVEFSSSRPPESTVVSNLTYKMWADRHEAIVDLGAWIDDAMTLNVDGGVERVRVGRVTPSLFPVLGVAPALGVPFKESETVLPDYDGIGGTTVILSHGFWQERYGGAHEVLGKTLTLKNKSRTIVGVMPAGFDFPASDTRLWVPMAVEPPFDPPIVRNGVTEVGIGMGHYDVVARLRPGFTAEQAATEAAARVNAPIPHLRPRVRVEFLGGDGIARIQVMPALDWDVREVKPALWVMFAAVALLFAAAIGNVANMQFARAAARQQEVAVRTAIGADAGRLARQLFIETLPVAVLGGALGLGLTSSVLRALPALMPEDFPRLEGVAVDGRVWLVVSGLTLMVAVLASLLPLRVTRRVKLTHVLAEDAAAPVGQSLRSPVARPRVLIITGQIAVAAFLLVGGAVLAQSFIKLVDADRGYQPDHLLTARINLNTALAPAARRLVSVDLADRMDRMPGVTNAGLAYSLPLTPAPLNVEPFSAEEPGRRGSRMEARGRQVSPGYFAAMGRRITRGRGFTSRDVRGSDQVLIVNETFVARYLSADPIGMVLKAPFRDYGDYGSPVHLWRVVGVVTDINNRTAGEPTLPEVFVSINQIDTIWRESLWAAVRTTGDPAALTDDLRALAATVDPRMTIDQVMTMQDRLDRSLARPRLYAVLLGGFAAFALLVAGIGLFGGMAYSVAQRRREIGVRTALGATPGDIIRLVVKQGATITAAGLVIGLGAAALTGQVLSAYLFGVTGFDPSTFAAVAGAIIVVALLACAIPARRAAKIDALTTLKR